MDDGKADGGTWRFLTNHAHVLLCLADDPGSRARDVAARIGITERATQRIVADLVAGGYVAKTRVGRRNRYTVNLRGPLRHPAVAGLEIGPVLDALGAASRDGSPARDGRRGPAPTTSAPTTSAAVAPDGAALSGGG